MLMDTEQYVHRQPEKKDILTRIALTQQLAAYGGEDKTPQRTTMRERETQSILRESFFQQTCF